MAFFSHFTALAPLLRLLLSCKCIIANHPSLHEERYIWSNIKVLRLALYRASFCTIVLDFKLSFTIKNYGKFTVNIENTP